METNPSNDFCELFKRDLKKVKIEIESYQNDDIIWIIEGEINNSAGNLALHICGNLKHFIGAQLANTGYERKRDFEFEGQVSREELISEVDTTIQVMEKAFEMITVDTLNSNYPLEPFGYKMSNFYFLNHLLGHLNYHLGQINYHRRLIGI